MKSFEIGGNQLKLVAAVSMLADHIGAAFFGGSPAYFLLRSIGRMAFPVFAFFLTEGCLHTHDKRKYLARLFAAACLSELPFLMLAGQIMGREIWGLDAVFTLLLGAGYIFFSLYVHERYAGNLPPHLTGLMDGAGLAACCLAAVALKTDYDCAGVVLVAVFFHFRSDRKRACMFGAALMIFAAGAWFAVPGYLAAFFLIYVCRTEMPWKIKWFYYVFYPLHMLLIVLAGRMMTGTAVFK